jgi:hypothetical protein
MLPAERRGSVKNTATRPALWVAGAAVGAAALWLGKRHFSQVSASHGVISDESDELEAGATERESGELPVGRSADPEIDAALLHPTLAVDTTSGASLFGEPEPPPSLHYREPALDEIWDAMPGIAEGEQTEGYDAVTPEDLGAVWLERATQTTHEDRPHVSDPADVPALEALSVSEASLASALALDELEADEGLELDEPLRADSGDDEIADDELGEPDDDGVTARELDRALREGPPSDLRSRR